MSDHEEHMGLLDLDVRDASGRIAPATAGKFRVVGVDTFDRDPDSHWVYGEYDTLDEAIACANAHGAPMLKTHVYDDQGRHLHDAGTV